MSVNKNTISILEALVAGEGSASVEELCNSLDLTRQLLHYYLGLLNERLQRAGFPKVTAEGDWLRLDLKASPAVASLIDDYDREDYAFVKEERHDLMLLLMALRPASVTISYLCDFFLVSRSTIATDISSLRVLLSKDGLGLISHAREGYRLSGEESLIRWYIMDCFYRLDSAVTRKISRNVMLESALEAMALRKDNQSVRSLRENLIGASPESLFDFIEASLVESITTVETSTHEKLAYSLLGELVYYLLSVVLRNCVCPSAIDAQVSPVTLERTPEWDVASLVMSSFAQIGLHVLPQEQEYVAALLRGSRVFSLDYSNGSSDDKAVELAEAVVSAFEQQMCTSIENRSEFMRRLLPHIRAMIYRTAFTIKLPGVIARHVRENYRQLYNVTNLVCKTLEERIGISFPPDEVAGLCIYFGSQNFDNHSAGGDLHAPLSMRRILIVCASGISTSLIVRQQMHDLLGSGFEYESCSLHEYSSVDSSNYDLIVTTVDAPEFDKSSLRVSPLLTKLQERRLLDWSVRDSMSKASPAAEMMNIIERYVDDHAAPDLLRELSSYLGGRDAPCPSRELHLLDILPASRIQFCDTSLGTDEAIRLGCAPLVRDGVVTDNYADKIMQTIQELGLYSECRREILIAHAKPGIESLGTGMSLTIFRQPARFEPWGRTYRVIFTLSATDSDTHVPAMRDLMSLLSSDKTCETLRNWSEDAPEALYLYFAAQLSERGT